MSINQFLTQLGSGQNIKNYAHARHVFVDNNYELSPKYSWLFHVSFELNSELSQYDRYKLLEAGMLVKSVNLPKFSVDTKVMNAYNRVDVVQNKINYDPVRVVLHDDSADVIRDLWFEYFNLYYRDSDHTLPTYGQNHKYAARQTQSWGYNPSRAAVNGIPDRLINSVRILSLHQRKFSEYVLVNPTIKSFEHGEHDNSRTDGTMEHTMTLEYETVLYGYGFVSPGENTDFATLRYDRTPSPLTPQGGGTQSVLGPGGLLSAVDGVTNQMGQGNLLGAGLSAFKTFENFKGQDIGKLAGQDLLQLGRNILNGQNPLSKIQIPSLGGLVNGGSATNFGAQGFGATGFTSQMRGQQGGPGSPSGATPGITAASPANTGAYFVPNYSSPGTQTASGVASSNGENLPVATAIPVNMNTTRPRRL